MGLNEILSFAKVNILFTPILTSLRRVALSVDDFKLGFNKCLISLLIIFLFSNMWSRLVCLNFIKIIFCLD